MRKGIKWMRQKRSIAMITRAVGVSFKNLPSQEGFHPIEDDRAGTIFVFHELHKSAPHHSTNI
jgi:hypothetical protein